jgi:hypothetical protein
MKAFYFFSVFILSSSVFAAPVEECVDTKMILFSEFVPTNFDEGRSTLGLDQVEPVKEKIFNFIKSHPEMKVTDVEVFSGSSQAPFYITLNGKTVINPKSDDEGKRLAEARASDAKTVLGKMKSSSEAFASLNIVTSFNLAGPKFERLDLNNRWVTKMTPKYTQRVEALYEKYADLYKEQALISSAKYLLDENKFGNLFLAKYKPFEGFRITIKGHIIEEMKCQVSSSKPTPTTPAGTSRQ